MKLIASDFDETLKRGGKVSLKDKRAIERMRKAGNPFLIVSGRNYDLIKDALRVFRVPYDYLILANGAIILDKDLNVLHLRYIDRESTEKVLDIIEKRNAVVAGLSDGLRYGVLKHGKSLYALLRYLVLSIRKTPLEQLKSDKIATFFVQGSEEETEELYQLLLQEKGLAPVKNVGTLVDIQSSGTDKSAALFWLKEYLGAEEVFAIGDSHNDLRMIKEHYGLAIAGAEKEVKDAARAIVHNFEEVEEIVTHAEI